MTREEIQQLILIAVSLNSATQDIKNNRNLDTWLETFEAAIAKVEKEIEDNNGNESFVKTLEDIKNNLYYLKYEILERI